MEKREKETRAGFVRLCLPRFVGSHTQNEGLKEKLKKKKTVQCTIRSSESIGALYNWYVRIFCTIQETWIIEKWIWKKMHTDSFERRRTNDETNARVYNWLLSRFMRQKTLSMRYYIYIHVMIHINGNRYTRNLCPYKCKSAWESDLLNYRFYRCNVLATIFLF